MAQKKIEGAGLGMSEQRALIESSAEALSIRRQGALVGLNRARGYNQSRAAGETEENLELMQLIDERYTAHHFMGAARGSPCWVVRGSGLIASECNA
jgi:hypothetical protein